MKNTAALDRALWTAVECCERGRLFSGRRGHLHVHITLPSPSVNIMNMLLCLLLGAPADIGDIDNTRALYERVLTEETNRKSTKLWEHYLAFEFEMGDLQVGGVAERRRSVVLITSTTLKYNDIDLARRIW